MMLRHRTRLVLDKFARCGIGFFCLSVNVSKEVNVCAGGKQNPPYCEVPPVQFPLYDDAKQPFSLTCSTALQPRGRRTESCRRLKSTLKPSTFIATLLALLLTASSLWAQRGSDKYVYRPVTILAGGYVPGLIAHPTESRDPRLPRAH
jgi:hypothetical protein